MKSLKDAVDLYRTLIAEGLSEFSYSERGQAIGRHLDDLAWRLSTKVALPRKPTDMSEAWQQVHGIDFADLIAEVEAPLVDRMDRLREVYRPAFESLAKYVDLVPEVQWREPTSRTAAAVEDVRKELKIKPFDRFEDIKIEPWQEAMQDRVNGMVRRLAEIQELGMHTALQETFIVGVDPDSEWTQISRARLEKMATLPVGEDKVGDWIMGIPLYDDPNDATMMRMKTADIYRAPNGPKIIEHVFGLSDPAATVDDNPTT